MLKKWKKRIIPAVCVMMVLVLGCIGFTGCGKEESTEEKVEDLAFTVVGERDVPQALAELLGKKRGTEFKLTYADGQDMYIGTLELVDECVIRHLKLMVNMK